MSLRHWLLLLASASTFASSILINKILVGQLPPFTLAAARAVLAAPICVLAMRLLGRRLPASAADRRTVVLAALGVVVVPYCALAIGQQTIPSGLSGILYSTMPLFTLLAAQFALHDEPLGVRNLSGVALGICGVVAVIGPSLLGGLGDHAVGELITLCGPLAYAMGTVLMRRSSHLDPIGLTAGIFVASAVILPPIAMVLEQPWALAPDADTIGLLLAMAVVGTIMPAALNYLLVQRVGATRASVAMFLMPLLSVLFGGVFLGERLGAGAFVGMALILSGSVLVNGLGLAAARPESSLGTGRVERRADD